MFCYAERGSYIISNVTQGPCLCEMSVIDVLVAMKSLICTKDQGCVKLPLVNYILQVK